MEGEWNRGTAALALTAIKAVAAVTADSGGRAGAGEGASMRTDEQIRLEVEGALHAARDLESTDIAVAVVNGVVTLTGFVRSYGNRARAEVHALQVEGVVGLANDIQVSLPLLQRRPDPQIAREAVAAIRHALPASWEHIQVIVHDGRATLEGEVEWEYQKQRAEEAVTQVRGLRALANEVRITLHNVPIELRARIEAAFLRNAEIDSDAIVIDIGPEGTLILSGFVTSSAEREQAERAARETPGVRRVENRIAVTAP